MDFRRLRYFKAIIDCNSIGEAAKLLNIAQPPLSQRLQELERELGVELLSRQGKTVKATEAGKVLYEYACDILRQVEEASQATILAGRVRKESLKIGVSPLFRSYFTPLVASLQEDPAFDLEVEVADSSYLEAQLNKRHIDLGFMQRSRNTGLYQTISLPSPAPVCVVSKTLDDNEKTWPLSKLDGMRLLLSKRTDGVGTFESVLTNLRKEDIYPEVVMKSTDPHILVDLIEEGLEAVAVIPSSEIRHRNLRNSRVVELNPSFKYFQPMIMRLKSFPIAPPVRSAIERAVRNLKDHG